MHRLVGCGLGHFDNGAPEVKLIRHVRSDSAQEQKEEVCGVPED